MNRATFHIEGLDYVIKRDLEYSQGTYRWRLGVKTSPNSGVTWEAYVDLPKTRGLGDAKKALLGSESNL